MTAPVIALPPRSPGLAPGELDRDTLARAVTFALDSVRAGLVDLYSFDDGVTDELWPAPGLVDGLFWRQSDWVSYKSTVPAYGRAVGRDRELTDREREILAGPACGTGCCIAGWIDVATRGVETASSGVGLTTREVAAWQLTGLSFYADTVPVLPPGVYVDDVNRALSMVFSAENELIDVIAYADELLRLYGQQYLDLDATGTFR